MITSSNRNRYNQTADTKETRLVAARRFIKSDRVRHRITGLVGSFVEMNYGFALPEVWVQFDSSTEIQVPTSCNPLDLERVNSEFNQREKMPSSSELSEAKATPVAAVEVIEELTQEEAALRHRLELKVERAFYEAGKALTELRDRRLYRSNHKNFEEYCHERFGMKRIYAHYLIAAAMVVNNLSSGCSQFVNILPTNESQCRPLTKLEAMEQCLVWQQAVEQAGGKVPSARIVKGIVERLKQKPLIRACDFGRVGDVFTLTGLVQGERKYNACPCVVMEVNDFTLRVDVHDATLTVKPDNLNSLDSPDARRELPAILKRIKRLRQRDLDRGAYPILEALGRQTYLTDLEAKVLAFLEQEYKIDD